MRLVRSITAAWRAMALSYLLIFCGHSADGRGKAKAVDSSIANTISKPKSRYGYLVLSTDAPKYGMKVGDTLSELPPSTVPESLRALTDARGHPIGTNWGPFDRRCVRYFSSLPAGAVVLGYSDNCITGTGSVEFVQVLFQRDSRGMLRPVGTLVAPYVEPYGRTIDGSPINDFVACSALARDNSVVNLLGVSHDS